MSKHTHFALASAMALMMATGGAVGLAQAKPKPRRLGRARRSRPARSRNGRPCATGPSSPPTSTSRPGKGPWPVVHQPHALPEGRPHRTRRRTPTAPRAAQALAKQAKRYTDAGYVFVLQDVRGKGHSQGFYAAFENDVEDGYDSVEWAAAQPWSNGKVGITGGSALGITSNDAAMAAPPHLKAAYVVVAPYDLLANSYMGGVLKEKDVLGWSKRAGRLRRGARPPAQPRQRRRLLEPRRDEHQPQVHQDPDATTSAAGTTSSTTATFRNFEYLQNQGAKGARGNQKLMMGPFGHGELSGDLEYPGSDRLSLGRRPGDPLVRLLAEGRRQRHHGRAAGQLLHDGPGAGRAPSRRRTACAPRPTGRRPTARSATT